MKNARRKTMMALSGALCLLSLAPRARADNPLPPTPMIDEKLAKPPIVLALEKVTEGLLMPSETYAPFKVVFLAREAPKLAVEGETETKPALSIQELAGLAGAPEDAKIETRDLDEFFAVATTTEDWMNDDERATAARFAALLDILKTQLKSAQVLVWGDTEKQIAILGEVEGGLAGVTTLIVQT